MARNGGQRCRRGLDGQNRNLWSGRCQQCLQTWVMSGNKQKMEYASLRRFICPPLQHSLTGGFIATLLWIVEHLFSHLMGVVLKVGMSTSDIVRLTSAHFLSERRKKASGWEKNVLYPMVMLILLAGTVRVRGQHYFCHYCLPAARAAKLGATGTNPQPLQFLSSAGVWRRLLIVVWDDAE